MNYSKKYLVCLSGTGSSDGAVKFAAKQIKKYGILIELLIAIPTEHKNFQVFMNKNHNDNKIAYDRAAAIMQMNLNYIIEETGCIPIHTIFQGEIHEAIKQKLLNDPNIILLILGSSASSFSKRKTISSLIEKIGESVMIPITIIPQNITEEQLSNLS